MSQKPMMSGYAKGKLAKGPPDAGLTNIGNFLVYELLDFEEWFSAKVKSDCDMLNLNEDGMPSKLGMNCM